MRGPGRKSTIVTVWAILILVGGVLVYRSVRPADDLPYDVVIVRRGDLVQQVSATGTIKAIITFQIGSQVAGTIKEIYVDDNSLVKRGQMLALIDPKSLEAQLTQARANLAAAKALLKKTDVQLKEAERFVVRIRNLFDRGDVSMSELDAAEASYYASDAQKEAQEAQVAQCEAAVTVAQITLGHTKIISPIDGIVLSRNVEIGQIVTGNPQPSMLFVIAADLTTMQITINVSEADIGHVKVGQEVSFSVDAYPEQTFYGKIKEIYMGPNIKQNVAYYDVISSVENAELLLRPGMTADVWIEIAHREDALLIPTIAVKQKNGQKYVEVWEGKAIQEKEVTIGLKGKDGLTEIISGLNEGEKVVASSR